MRPATGRQCCPVGESRGRGPTPTARTGTPTEAALEQAMKGHVLEEAQLVGTYQKK